MAVGAGSIKRASKLNADAESKKTVEAVAESVSVQETEAKTPAKKTTTSKSTTTKSTSAKTTAKSTTTKTTAKKAPAKKAVEEKAVVEVPVEEKPVEVATTVESSVITNIDPVVLDVVLGKKTNTNKACHLTEDMPIHLL